MSYLQRRLAEARRRDEGFTLIELAVVILIIGILLAVAIPTFLNVRKGAQNKAAQSSVRNALTSAKAWASDEGSYKTAPPAPKTLNDMLHEGAPELEFVAGGSTGPKSISTSVDTQTGTLILAAKSQTGDCFYLRDNLDDAGEIVGTGQYGKATGSSTCSASTAPSSWTSKW